LTLGKIIKIVVTICHIIQLKCTIFDCATRREILCSVTTRPTTKVVFGVNRLYRQLTFVVDDPEKVYPTTSVIWARFVSLYRSTFDLLLYAPVFRAYSYQSLHQLYDDGVQYAEIRILTLPVFIDFHLIFVSAVWGFTHAMVSHH